MKSVGCLPRLRWVQAIGLCFPVNFPRYLTLSFFCFALFHAARNRLLCMMPVSAGIVVARAITDNERD